MLLPLGIALTVSIVGSTLVGPPSATVRADLLAVRELRLGDATAEAAGGVQLDSGKRATPDFSVFGVSWANTSATVTVRYRTEARGVWGDWNTVGEGGEEQGTQRTNTDAIVASRSTALDVEVTGRGGPVDDVIAVLVDPGDDPPATTPAVTSGGGRMSVAWVSAATSTVTTARPTVITRAQWGADESLRTCTPDYSTSMVSAAVHHTVSPNDYTAGDAAGLVRGIYAYHTRPEAHGGRGWCDIGYNALVDRFGRIYEGRLGSFDETVVGVHTGGFNSRTFGVSAIGDFSTFVPPPAVIEGLAQAISWRFTTSGILANASVTMVSGGGASKYPEGTAVTFPTIYGHRDAQLTSCPGEQLYTRLQQVRDRVAELSNASVLRSPSAFWDVVTSSSTAVSVAGWAFDPDSDESLTVDVVVDRVSHPVRADVARPDVAAAFGVGRAHGFSATVPLAEGDHLVCLWARNVGDGNDHLLGCRTMRVSNAAPKGFLDGLTVSGSIVTAAGWAFDPDSADPVDVHLYAGATFLAAGRADGDRPDIAAAFPGAGAAHGFAMSVPVAAGTHAICAYATNVPSGANPLLGCRTITVVNAPPVGYVDQAAATSSTVRMIGWALDPETTAPIQVHLYGAAGFLGAVTADVLRPDVAVAYPSQPASHGFDVTLPFDGASQDVCAYAINVPVGINPSLGCRHVTPPGNSTPLGFLDAATASGSAIAVAGWTYDADTAAPLQVHVYVDGAFAGAGTADQTRPDVAVAFPGVSAAHGYVFAVPAAPGAHRVCTFAINVPAGVNPELGCLEISA